MMNINNKYHHYQWYFLILIVVGLFILYMCFSSTSNNFQDDFISGLFVVIVGIPVGLYIDRKKQRDEELIKEKEERKQEFVVLKALSEELQNSYSFLSSRIGVDNNVVADRINLEVWNTFLYSGRLKCISYELLPVLSQAYELLRKIQKLEDDALKGFAFHPTTANLDNGLVTQGWNVILMQARSFDNEISDSIEKALNLSEKRIKVLEN